MANNQEGCAEILKVPRVYVPGQTNSFPWDISPENLVEEEIERLVDRYQLPGSVDDYEMELTNPRGTVKLLSSRTFESYEEKFQLFLDGRPNVTLRLLQKGESGTADGQGGQGQGPQSGGDRLSSLKINVKRD